MNLTNSTDPKIVSTKAAEILNDLKSHQDIVKKAHDYAFYATFNEGAGKFTKHIEGIRRDFPILRVVIPFVRIAGNLFRQGFQDWTPIGFVSKRPDLDAVQKAQFNARAAIGTGLMATGMAAYLNENFILGAPENPVEKARFYQEKKQPWSVRIPVGDRVATVPIRRLEPNIMPFAVGAIIAKNIQDGVMSVQEAEETIASAAFSTIKGTIMDSGQLALESSYIQSLANFTEAFSGGYESDYKFDQLIAQPAAGLLVPASGLWRSVAYALDPTLRKPEGPTEIVYSQLPFASEKVQPRVTPFGEEAQRPGGRLAGFLFIRPQMENQDPAVIEIGRLDINVGLATPEIRGVKLEGDGKTAYQKLSGKIVHYFVLNAILNPSYESLSDEQKKMLLKRSIDKARDVARSAWLSNQRTFDSWSQAVGL